MSTRPQQKILVGVHGSAASAAALRWAAEETQRRDAWLLVVYCQEPPPGRAPYAPGADARDAGRPAARADLAGILRDVLGPPLPAALSAQLMPGTPERVLVGQSAMADLLVIGSAATAADDRAMGPVIRACLRGAACPVVVVHPDGLLPARLAELARS